MNAYPRYAKALFELATEARQLPAVIAAVDALREALGDHEIRKALANPRLGEVKRDKLARLLAQTVKAPHMFAATLRLLAANNRMAELPDLCDAFGQHVDAANGTIRARVAVAVPMQPAQKQALQYTLEKWTHAKQVVLNETVNPSLIGGFCAIFAGKVWDASLRGKIEKLRTTLHRRARQQDLT